MSGLSRPEIPARISRRVRGGSAIPIAMADTDPAMEPTRRAVFEHTAREAAEEGESIDDALRPVLLEDLETVRRASARRG